MANNNELFAGYIPVIHEGYIEAFNRHPDATIGIFNEEVLKYTAPYLRKDIRAISPENAMAAIEGLGRKSIILGHLALETALKQPITMPEDDITRKIIELYPEADITTEPVFLRWDRDNSTEKSAIKPDRIIRVDESDEIIKTLNYELKMSPNWFRHVAAVVHDEKNIYFSGHNASLPTDYTSLIESDPRITANRGELIERSIDIHAETRIIADAARSGISLEGLSISVSTFPCPNCAKLIALSGIKTVNYIEGYSVLDGQNILKSFGVEIVKLESELDPEDIRSLKPYPESTTRS